VDSLAADGRMAGVDMTPELAETVFRGGPDAIAVVRGIYASHVQKLDELESQARQIQDAAALLPLVWIPVSERMPEEYQTVLVMTDAGVSAGEIRFPDSECEMDEPWWMVFKDMRDRLNSWAGFIPLSVVTHWMPLPEPPEKK
jgi:hypothetical protein